MLSIKDVSVRYGPLIHRLGWAAPCLWFGRSRVVSGRGVFAGL